MPGVCTKSRGGVAHRMSHRGQGQSGAPSEPHEQADGDATEFRELWLLTRLKGQSGEAWQLAQVQALA